MENSVFQFNTRSPVNIGDLVVLKSGGPLMTVRAYIPGKGGIQGSVTVDWFVSDENYSATFYENQLMAGSLPSEK